MTATADPWAEDNHRASIGPADTAAQGDPDAAPMTTEPKPEGWGVIRPGNRIAHYYRDSFSLCRRVGFYFGPVDSEDKPSRDDCGSCRKVLIREAKARAKAAGLVGPTP